METLLEKDLILIVRIISNPCLDKFSSTLCLSISAYENVAQHTAGFLGLQIALILIAFHNAGFVWDSNIAYKFLGGSENGLRNTRIVIIVYLIGQVTISIAKVYTACYIVAYGRAAAWTLQPVGPVVSGQVVDWIWMLFNAIIPLIIAYIRSRNEAPLVISVSQKTIYFNIPDNVVNDDSQKLSSAFDGTEC